jgi:Mor family transcriptional regulator
MKFSNNSSDTYKALVRLIGVDNTRKLLVAFGGKTLYIPKVRNMLVSRRDEEICRDYQTGQFTLVDLTKKFGVSKATVARALAKGRKCSE